MYIRVWPPESNESWRTKSTNVPKPSFQTFDFDVLPNRRFYYGFNAVQLLKSFSCGVAQQGNKPCLSYYFYIQEFYRPVDLVFKGNPSWLDAFAAQHHHLWLWHQCVWEVAGGVGLVSAPAGGTPDTVAARPGRPWGSPCHFRSHRSPGIEEVTSFGTRREQNLLQLMNEMRFEQGAQAHVQRCRICME